MMVRFERDVITTGYITDSKGRKWRVCEPGNIRVIIKK